jgi:hypothetical protein
MTGGAVVVVQLRGAFQQARVQEEHVARIGFAARRAAQQERHLAVGDGLLRQVVIADQRVLAVVAEIFAHGAGGERRDELHRGRVGRGGGDDDRVFERPALLEHLHELRDGRALLADGDVDAVELFLVGARLMDRLLVQDRVENDGGLAGLAVADDQLALAAADRDERVDRLEAGRHRLMHRLARDDAGRLDVDAAAFCRDDRALAVDRVAERVDDAAEQAGADRHVDDRAGALDGVAFLDVAVGAEDDDADIVGFEVERHAADAAGELDHFAGLDIVEAIDAGDAVTDGENLTYLGNFGFLDEILDLVLENCGNFRGADVHQPTSLSASLSELSLVRSEVSIWREPIFTTRPPRREGSTVTAMVTSFPATALRAVLSSVCCAAVSACAEVTSAATSPRCSAAMARNALIIDGTANRRRFCATTFRKLPVRADMPAFFTIAEMALNWSSEEKTGLSTRRFRSAEPASIVSKLARSFSTAATAFASTARSNSEPAYLSATPEMVEPDFATERLFSCLSGATIVRWSEALWPNHWPR